MPRSQAHGAATGCVTRATPIRPLQLNPTGGDGNDVCHVLPLIRRGEGGWEVGKGTRMARDRQQTWRCFDVTFLGKASRQCYRVDPAEASEASNTTSPCPLAPWCVYTASRARFNRKRTCRLVLDLVFAYYGGSDSRGRNRPFGMTASWGEVARGGGAEGGEEGEDSLPDGLWRCDPRCRPADQGSAPVSVF